MTQLRARAALFDIEGTLGSVAFVREVLFPYADARMDDYVRRHAGDAQVRAILDYTARDTATPRDDLNAILRTLHEWSAQDRKITALKSLQGLIWDEAYRSGAVHGHLYDDAVAALRRFHAAGVALYVYSSGSIEAQKLLFAHSVAGNLLGLFSGFFDTTSGGKGDPESYVRIASDIDTAPSQVVFFSDISAELDAANAAGFVTVQLARPDDGTLAAPGHLSVRSFEGLEIRTG